MRSEHWECQKGKIVQICPWLKQENAIMVFREKKMEEEGVEEGEENE